MHYRTFAASRFRGLSNVRINDFGRVNLITGLNGVGKTSLLEAMFLHACGPLAGEKAVQVLRPARNQAIELGTQIENPWESLFQNMDTAAPIVLEGKTSDGSTRLELDVDQTAGRSAVGASGPGSDVTQIATTSLLIKVRSGQGKTNQYRQLLTINTGASPLGGSGQAISVQWRLEPPATKPLLPAAMLRPGAAPDLARLYSIARQRQSGRLDLLKALQDIDTRIQSIEVLSIGTPSQLYAELSDGTLIPFGLLGDGANAMAAYMLQMLEVRHGVLFLDEVGHGIHHTRQVRMWELLYRAAESFDVQIVATTHSAEAIRAAVQVLRKRPSELHVMRLARRHDGDEVVSYTGDELQLAEELNVELR